MPSVKNFNLPPEIATDVEQWQSTVLGDTYVKRLDAFGNVSSQRVTAKKIFSVTPLERRLHQQGCVSADLDPYLNGRLQPVKLIDSEPDTAVLQAMPNALSETAMKALFHSQLPTFTTKVQAITNTATLERLKEVAQSIDAKFSQVAVIDARLDVVSGKGTFSKVQVGEDVAHKAGVALP
jgi:hypothetical protein